MTQHKLAILGTVGVPGTYGGFETLAENLVVFHEHSAMTLDLTVYCSANAYPGHPSRFRSADLVYLQFDANGAQSILYDIVSLFSAVRNGHDRLLLLGVSGAIALPLIRLVSRARISTNIDGIEWKREKWKGIARIVLRASEWFAVRFSHVVIADNQAIADYVTETYGRSCTVIAYGGDHALDATPDDTAVWGLPADYSLALCRIEPENNVEMILDAWRRIDTPLVFVGNWSKSDYGRRLRDRFSGIANITMLEPVYEAGKLRAIRNRASVYIHGHSAGGTNPSLVEMMHFGIPVLAYGCNFNRYTTHSKAAYFTTAEDLVAGMSNLTPQDATQIGKDMQDIARLRYTWGQIGKDYFELITS